MSGLEPFTPDEDYCVYCHAPAAGMCGECGAVCCADCTELVMGWTTQQAVCLPCLRARPGPAPRRPRPALLVGVIAAALAAAYLIAR
jgi:hypothetical protein